MYATIQRRKCDYNLFKINIKKSKKPIVKQLHSKICKPIVKDSSVQADNTLVYQLRSAYKATGKVFVPNISEIEKTEGNASLHSHQKYFYDQGFTEETVANTIKELDIYDDSDYLHDGENVTGLITKSTMDADSLHFLFRIVNLDKNEKKSKEQLEHYEMMKGKLQTEHRKGRMMVSNVDSIAKKAVQHNITSRQPALRQSLASALNTNEELRLAAATPLIISYIRGLQWGVPTLDVLKTYARYHKMYLGVRDEKRVENVQAARNHVLGNPEVQVDAGEVIDLGDWLYANVEISPETKAVLSDAGLTKCKQHLQGSVSNPSTDYTFDGEPIHHTGGRTAIKLLWVNKNNKTLIIGSVEHVNYPNDKAKYQPVGGSWALKGNMVNFKVKPTGDAGELKKNGESFKALWDTARENRITENQG